MNAAHERPHPSRYRLCLLIVVLLFIAINARWLWVYRHGLTLDIDEAGYVCFAVIDYYRLLYGGFHGWIAAIEMPSIQAPLTTAMASLVFALVGPHVSACFVVPLAAGAGCIIAAYLLGREIGAPRVGLVACMLTASCPSIVKFTDSFHFAMPATLVTTMALVAILRSRRFHDIGWSLVFGLCLGLMPLARTMTIAFMPGVVLAALAAVAVDPTQRGRRLSMLAGSLVLAMIVSATWLWPNGVLVAHYLLSFGYGNHALEYGTKTSKLGFDAWGAMIQAYGADVYLPHLLVTLLGLAALLTVTLRAMARHGLGSTARRVITSPAFPVAIFSAEAIVMLTTSGNKGGGFFAPIVPALMVLTAWGFARLSEGRLVAGVVTAIVTIVTLAGAVPHLALRTPLTPETIVTLPILGTVTVTDGRGNIQREQANLGYGVRGSVEPVDRADSRAWVNLSTATATLLTQEFGAQAHIAYGFRNGLYNVNTINLQELLNHHSAFAATQVDPAETGLSVSGYRGWLQTSAASACALLTSDRPGGDFLPAINRPMMMEAARQAGFSPRQTWPTPDGQIVTLWTPPVMPPDCHA